MLIRQREVLGLRGGATWKDYDRETQVFGLASTGGAVSRTGVAGLTLGGGWGWLAGKYGLACDNLRSVDVVTSDGKVVTANANQNSDLFWGLRGGGGNFGIATSFEFTIHPVREILAGTLFFTLDTAKEILVFYDKFTRSCPDELASLIVFVNVEGKMLIGVTVCYCGEIKILNRIDVIDTGGDCLDVGVDIEDGVVVAAANYNGYFI